MPSDKYWKMLDTDYPPYVKELVGLITLSQSCEFPTPLHIFLDLIGWTEDNHGSKYLNTSELPDLGYLELGYLADALSEYTARPLDVREWYDLLAEEESK